MFLARQPVRHYDAIVIGARCAGAATALQLAQEGLRVLVVDRQPHGSDTLSTHALMRGAVLLLGRWGVLPDILAAGTPPVRRTAFHFGNEVLEIPIKPTHGVEALVAPRRSRLDRLLVDHAIRAGAEVHHGITLAAITKSDDGRVNGVVLKDRDGLAAEVHCDLLIGADGLRSRVAQEVGAPVLRSARHSAATIYGYWDGLERDAYHWHYASGAAAGVIATDDGQACVFVAAPEDRVRRELRGDMASAHGRLLREAAPSLAGRLGPETARLQGFWGAAGFMRRAHGPGWALVGDAGYFKDPITAHGITDAFRDAALLAGAIRDGTDAALARYQEERDELSRDLFEVTEEIASFAWDLDTIPRLLERLNAAMKAEVAMLATRGPEPVPKRRPNAVAPAVH